MNFLKSKSPRKLFKNMLAMSKFNFGGVFLIVGYIFGQGSAFLVQLLAREQGSIVAGQLVLYLGLFSICFQFSDIGNSTIGVKTYLERSVKGLRLYLLGRGVIAIPAAVVATLFLVPDSAYLSSSIVLVFTISIAATLFALTESAKLEANRNYFLLALVQSFPWVATSIFLYFSLVKPRVEFDAGLFVWLILPIIVLSITKSQPVATVKEFRFNKLGFLLLPLAFIIPVILAQFWAREMLILITNAVGIESIGPLGLVRSVQTAGCVAIGMLARPIIGNYIHSITGNPDRATVPLMNKFFPLIAMVSIPFVFILLIPLTFVPDDIRRWFPVLLGVPIWGVTSVYIAQNQIFFSGKLFSAIEILGLVINAVAFFVIIDFSPEWAFPAADFFRLIFFIVVSKLSKFFTVS